MEIKVKETVFISRGTVELWCGDEMIRRRRFISRTKRKVIIDRWVKEVQANKFLKTNYWIKIYHD